MFRDGEAFLRLTPGAPASSVPTSSASAFDDRCSHRSLAFVRKAYVEHVQAGMVFGGRKNAWQDVEVDETSFDKEACSHG